MTTPQNPFEGQFSPEEVMAPQESTTPAWEAFGAGLPTNPAAGNTPVAGLPVSMPTPPPTEDAYDFEDGPVAPPATGVEAPQPVSPAYVVEVAQDAPVAPPVPVIAPAPLAPAGALPAVPAGLPGVAPMVAPVEVSVAVSVDAPADVPVVPVVPVAAAPSVAAGPAGLPVGPAPVVAAAAPQPGIPQPGIPQPGVAQGSAPQPPVVAPVAAVPPIAAPVAAPVAPATPMAVAAPVAPAAHMPAPDTDGPVAPLAGSAPTYEEVVEKVQQVSLDDILMAVTEAGGSDLHLAADAPPRMRVRGNITVVKGFQPITAEQLRSMLYGIMTSKQQARYEENLGLDFSYTVPGQARFRVNVFRQRGLMGAVMRAIPWEILTFDALNIDESIGAFADLQNGLVLVTGPTGSGKSTTLAAVLDRANRTREDHIMTVEDPIEFLHQSRKCIVNQREVGDDTLSFKDALREALRQDPDIILVGEMRDLETISIALTAAETGHLVFGTLHTQSAQDTITRIIDAYPSGEKNQVQAQLAASLRAVVCQTLVPTADRTGRQAALEVMVANSNIKSLIRDGKLQQIQSALQSGAKHGMWTLNADLARLVLEGRILYSDAVDRCSDEEDLRTLVGGGDPDAAEEAAAQALKRAEEARNPEPKTNPGAMFGGVPMPRPASE